jgi:WW domain-containing oxidoreductase
MFTPFSFSKDGIEIQFATNHLGHFYLTKSLLPHLFKSKAMPRVVNISSVAHLSGPSQGICTLEELNNEATMNNLTRYGHSKLANILFSKGLDERYGDKLIVNSAHPGWVRFS